jgi:hypothetical protein
MQVLGEEALCCSSYIQDFVSCHIAYRDAKHPTLELEADEAISFGISYAHACR